MTPRAKNPLLYILVISSIFMGNAMAFADMRGPAADLERSIRDGIGKTNYVEPLIVAKKLKIPQYHVFTEVRSTSFCGEAELRYLAAKGTNVSYEAMRDSVIGNAVSLGYRPTNADVQEMAAMVEREKQGDSQLREFEQILLANHCATKDVSGILPQAQMSDASGHGDYFGMIQQVYPVYGQKNLPVKSQDQFLILD